MATVEMPINYNKCSWIEFRYGGPAFCTMKNENISDPANSWCLQSIHPKSKKED